ncbi:MAG: ketopantoate reductase family protein [Nitrospinota bacterium]
MKILVIGAGAVGGYFGGRLARAGHELYFIARGDHLKAIKKDGLFVKSPQSDFHIKPRAEGRFEPIDSLDLIMVCVKHHYLDGVLPIVKEQAGENCIVISLLNGVDSEDILMDAVKRNQVIGAIAYIGSELTAPGRIRHTAAGKITLGEMDCTETRRLENLKKVFNDASIPCGTSSNIRKAFWEKLMWNVGFNGLSALTGRSAQEILAHKPTETIVRRLMEELVAVAAGTGIGIDPQMIDKQMDFTKKSDVIIPSMLQDVRRGRKTEIDIMNGKIVNEGLRQRISTPYNDSIWAAVSLLDFDYRNRQD